MKRDFNNWLADFRPSIADYKYYVNFDKVYKNTGKFKLELNMLNSLIGSKNIEEEWNNLINKYPEVLKAVPLLLAKRENEIRCTDEKGSFTYNFKRKNLSNEQYTYFMRETGLFDLLQNHIVNNLVDYVTGVNVGLDSNARKNRGGHLMENLVESFIIKAGFVKDSTYFKEMYISEIEEKFNLDLSKISSDGDTEKRFDFVINYNDCVYGIECNFFTSEGSKLNETARSYKMIAEESKDIEGFKFIWFTDGKGWIKARNNLKETFKILDTIYNIKELESNTLKNLLKQKGAD